MVVLVAALLEHLAELVQQVEQQHRGRAIMVEAQQLQGVALLMVVAAVAVLALLVEMEINLQPEPVVTEQHPQLLGHQ
jgi:hypothetical protein